MITGPKTVLLADDDPALQWLYQHSLPPHLPGFDVATVSNGQEAIDYLSAHSVSVLVTDISMPLKDGFEVLAHVRNRHPNVPAIVLASLAPKQVIESAPQLGAMHVLQKPVAPELLAKRILAAYGETTRGRISGVPLVTLVQLVQAERKSCSLLLRTDAKQGRLHFLSGELVNAYAFELDTDGEEAARYLLTLDNATVDFERSLHNHIRTIHTTLATLLLEVAKEQDERDRAETSSPAPAPPAGSSLVAAADELHASLAGLRRSTGRASELLAAAAPSILEGVGALAAERGRGVALGADDARLSTAWREVSALAARLADAAEALGAAPDGH